MITSEDRRWARSKPDDLRIKPENINDELKLKVLIAAYNKYTLEELQEKLNIKNNEY